jgi:hypothetical protein
MYSLDLKKKVHGARTKGWSWKRISEAFDIPMSSCRKIVANKDVPRPPSHKPNLKIKGNVKKRLLLAIKELQHENSRVTSPNIVKKAHQNVNLRTVERFMKKEGYRYLNTKKEIVLTAAHKAARVEICKKWLKEGAASQKIIFTDETRFNLDGPDHDMSWQQPGQRRKRPRRQQGGGGILIWGMLLPSGELHYTEIVGSVNSVKYMKMLKDFALPQLEILLDDDWVWQQDNATAHVSQATQVFLEQKGVRLLGWPAKSPDLNVIENVWNILDGHIYQHGAAQNMADLRNKVKEAVAHFNNQIKTGKSIYNSYGERIFKCYELGGALVKF